MPDDTKQQLATCPKCGRRVPVNGEVGDLCLHPEVAGGTDICPGSWKGEPLMAARYVPGEWPEHPLPPHSHVLKIRPVYFRQVRDGEKRFELRKDDRPFRVGDVLDLREFDPTPCPYPDTGIVGPTGECVQARITHILRGTGEFGLERGHVCMSIEVIS